MGTELLHMNRTASKLPASVGCLQSNSDNVNAFDVSSGLTMQCIVQCNTSLQRGLFYCNKTTSFPAGAQMQHGLTIHSYP